MTLVLVFGITLAVIAIAVLAMAVGVMTSGRCMKGGCGSHRAEDDAAALHCADCPNRPT